MTSSTVPSLSPAILYTLVPLTLSAAIRFPEVLEVASIIQNSLCRERTSLDLILVNAGYRRDKGAYPFGPAIRCVYKIQDGRQLVGALTNTDAIGVSRIDTRR